MFASRFYRLALLALLAITLAACVNTVTSFTDVAAPQPYRPLGLDNQWEIAGKMDSKVHRDWNGAVVEVSRHLEVRINGAVAIDGDVPTDRRGNTTGTLTGTYDKKRINADCSSQEKNADWIEIRCRVLVNDEHAATLVL